ncbi:hypothetical protein ACET3Z_030644 [Daucus carota]
MLSKETMDEYQKIVFELAIIIIAKFLLGEEGDAQRWKAGWVAGTAAYAIFYHSIKIFVRMKRDQVALRDDAEVWAFIFKHISQFLIPLSYSSLAYDYLMGIEKNWKMVAVGIRMFTLVVGSLLVLGACKICYSAADDQNQIIAIQTNMENQSVANHVLGLGQNVEDQSFAPEMIEVDVDDHSYCKKSAGLKSRKSHYQPS